MSNDSAFEQAVRAADLDNRAIIRGGRDGVTVYVRAEGEPPPVVDLFFGGVVIVLDSCEPGLVEVIQRAFASATENRKGSHPGCDSPVTSDSIGRRRP